MHVFPKLKLRIGKRSIFATLAVITSFILLRSFCIQDDFIVAHRHSTWHMQSCDGFLSLGYSTSPITRTNLHTSHTATSIHFPTLFPFINESLYSRHFDRSDDRYDYELAGFRISGSSTDERFSTLAQLPTWLPAIAFSFLASRGLRRSRRPASACPTCSYDTRATPTRCPECGTSLTGATS